MEAEVCRLIFTYERSSILSTSLIEVLFMEKLISYNYFFCIFSVKSCVFFALKCRRHRDMKNPSNLSWVRLMLLLLQDHLKEPRVARTLLIAHIESILLCTDPSVCELWMGSGLICKIVNHNSSFHCTYHRRLGWWKMGFGIIMNIKLGLCWAILLTL